MINCYIKDSNHSQFLGFPQCLIHGSEEEVTSLHEILY